MSTPNGGNARRIYGKIRQAFPDIGTAFLGLAALFFVRAVPPTASLDLNLWPLTLSGIFFVFGLYLRAFFRD